MQSEQRSECRVDTGCRAPAPAVVVVPLVPWFGSTVSAGRPVVGSTGGRESGLLRKHEGPAGHRVSTHPLFEKLF